MSWSARLPQESLVSRTVGLISESFGVPLFSGTEKERQAHAKRLAWSLAGRRMLASLFDEVERGEDGAVSITHAKRAFFNSYAACYAIFYSTLGIERPSPTECRRSADEAFDAYLDAGFFRHTPYWVKSAPFRASSDLVRRTWPETLQDFVASDKATLLRGVGPGLDVRMSGLGPWLTETKRKEIQIGSTVHSDDFIGFHVESREDGWKRLLRNARWERVSKSALSDYEIFVFIHPGIGVWKRSSEVTKLSRSHVSASVASDETDVYFSLARIRLDDAPRTFLLRSRHGDIELSPLSEADALRGNEWLIAAACCMGAQPLCTAQSVSASVCEQDLRRGRQRKFVSVKLSMRPSRELEAFLRVYSWPADMDAPKPWARIMPDCVFTYFLPHLMKEGFYILSKRG